MKFNVWCCDQQVCHSSLFYQPEKLWCLKNAGNVKPQTLNEKLYDQHRYFQPVANRIDGFAIQPVFHSLVTVGPDNQQIGT